MKMKYFLNKPWVPDDASEKIQEALASLVQQGDGRFTKEVVNLLNEKYFAEFQNFTTPSCTASLEIASMTIDLKSGDEVIMPSFNFTSAPLAVSKFGATPVFVDIKLSNGCIDVDQIFEAITPRTKAISWVNYGGLVPDQKSLIEISSRFGLTLIEDHAHGFGADGRYGIGEFLVSSFHATKNLQCGEGGHIGVRNFGFARKVEVIREKGTNRSEFIKGIAKKYQWLGEGGSYLLPEICSAVLYSQIKASEYIQEERRRSVKLYEDFVMDGLLGAKNIHFLNGLIETSHMFAFLLPNLDIRQKVIESLAGLGIQAASHYEDLYSSPHGQVVGKLGTTNEVSLDFSQRLIRLPLYIGLTESDIEEIAKNTVSVVRRLIR